MPDDFSFASLMKPGEGSMRSLRMHLQACQAREVRHKKPHWVYSGACDLLLRHGRFFNGRELPGKWEHLRGPQNACHDNALAAAEADPSLRYFTGMYVIGREPCQHSWCVDRDGGLLEVTLPNAAMRGRTPVLGDHTGDPTSLPMLTPPHWSYVGVEYSTAFVREHMDTRGLPLLDPHYRDHNYSTEFGCYLPREDPPMWCLPYDKAGFAIPPAPTNICVDCIGQGEDEDGDDCLPCGGKGWL